MPECVEAADNIGRIDTLRRQFSSPLDPGIEPLVHVLLDAAITTVESCQGGGGHAFEQPTVVVRGSTGEAWRALGIAMDHGFPVSELRKVWTIEDGDPVGPYWWLVLRP